MVMDVKGIMRAIRGEKVIFAKGELEVVSNRGGWSKVTMRDSRGRAIEFSLRSNQAREIIEQSHHLRYSTEADRLYSKWIETTKAGKQYTARRQVEGMRTRAEKAGMVELVEELDKVLAHSDDYVAKYREDWEKEMGDKAIEQFYSYDPGVSEFSQLLQ